MSVRSTTSLNDADDSWRTDSVDLTAVAEICAEVLGAPVGPNENLLRRGADSLALTRIVARLAARSGRRLPLRAVFDDPTPSALVDALRRSPPTPPLPDHESSPSLAAMSHSQERMWFLHQLDEHGSAYNIESAVRVRADIDVSRLRSAVRSVVARHGALRTGFTTGDHGPVHRVHPSVDVEVGFLDCSTSPDPEAVARRDFELAAKEPFDLTNPPLLRARLYRLGAHDHIVFVCVHHVVCDQWGMGVLMNELSHAYAGSSSVADVALAADAFGGWHRSWSEHHSADGQMDYWRTHLRELPTVSFPTDRVRPAQPTYAGAIVTAELGGRIADVARLAAELEATPFMVYLAAFDVVVERYTGSADVVVGTPIANRNVVESEGVVTSVVNTVVLRTDLSGGPTAAELIRRVRDVSIDAFDNQDVPFAAVVAELAPVRTGERSPLFQVFFNAATAPFAPFAVHGAESKALVVDRGGAQFELSLGIDLVQTLTATVEYNTNLFERATAEQLLDHYLLVLDAFLADPDAPIQAIEMITAAEQDALQRSWSDCDRPFDQTATIHSLIGDRVLVSPTATAVTGPDGDAITYRELEERSNQLAHHLLDEGVAVGDLVGLMVDRSIHMVIAMIGILKVGAAYVPLDPGYPAERLEFMVDDARLRLIVTEQGVASEWVQTTHRCVLLDRDAPVLGRRPVGAVGVHVEPTDRAYVIYTSGSTGTPKGVELEHRSVVNFLHAMQRRPGLDSDDILLAVTTLSFDIAVLEIFLPLVVGASVVVAARATAASPEALQNALVVSGATVFQATPSMWRMLVESGWKGDPNLTILCGGEALPRELADELIPRARAVWNMYGPTETTVWSAALQVEMSPGPVLVGGPIDNTRLYVLDRLGRRVPAGVPGELFIGGDGLARGYLGRSELTAERFVVDPFREAGSTSPRMYRTGDLVRRRRDGLLEFLGRIDNQVKLRGHRIELGEIEALLTRHPSVAEAIVLARMMDEGDSRLVAYVVRSNAAQPDLRPFLRDHLPEYMVPSAIVEMDSLPMTPNGKVDRNALPDPRTASHPAVTEPPLPGLETVVADIWCDVLNVSTVSRHDDFFDLGGHSLLAVRLFARIQAATDVRLPLTTLFRARTIAALVRAMTGPSARQRWTSLVPVAPGVQSPGTRPPFFYVSPFLITALSFSHLARHLGDEQPFYVLQPQGMESEDEIHDRVEDMASHYLDEIRDVQPVGPYRIGGHCAGSWVAFEMARQLESEGESVETLVLVDSEPPGIDPPRSGRLRHRAAVVRYYLRSGRLLDAARWKLSVWRERHQAGKVDTTDQTRVARLRDIHAESHRGYRGGTIAAEITFVRSEQSASLATLDWHLRWRELTTSRMRVMSVPGAHSGLVDSDHAEALASCIRTALDLNP